MDPLVHDIAATPQTFIDDAMIAAATGLERRVHALTKHSDRPVVECTEPWEGSFLGPVRVLFDEELGLWRMWYKSNGARQVDLAGHSRGTLHLAFSQDGIHWEKRPLGAYALDGHGDTNICVFEDGRPVPGGRALFEDRQDPDPTRRFKLITYQPNYYLAYSADGIHWRKAQDEPVWSNGAGDGLEETSFFMHDPLVNKYRGYMRVWRRHQTLRKTSLGESDDLVHWTGPQIIWEAQPEFGPGAQIYGMHVHIDGGLYWAFPWIFYTDEPLDEALRQTIRLKMGWSRDGVTWQALAPHQDAVPMGAAGSFDFGMMIAECPAVLGEHESWLYYTGCDERHDRDNRTRGIGLARWRRGGLVSLHTQGDGALLTRRFVLRGSALHLNARTAPGGYIKAELLDDSGNLIETHNLDAADAFTGSAVDHPLTWDSRSDLTPLRGQYLMLRLTMHKAEVFAFRQAGSEAQFAAPLGPPPVRCGRLPGAGAAPTIDGKLDEECWQDFTHSGVADNFVQFTEIAPAATRTRALFTHDGENLYIAVECEEPLTDKLTGGAGGNGPGAGEIDYSKEDLIELRLSGPEHGTHVHQLMVTASGRKQHAWFSKEEGDTRLLERADWEAKTNVLPGHWDIEMAVPFESLTARPPEAGEQWKLNIIRYRYTAGSEVSCWSCMFGSVHRNDVAGTMVLG